MEIELKVRAEKDIAEKLANLHPVAYLGLFSVAIVCQNYVIGSIGDLVFGNAIKPIIFVWWVTVFVGPIFENLVFQGGLCWALLLFGIPGKWVVGSTGLLFGLLHLHLADPISSALNASIAGSVFSWMYVFRSSQNRTWQGLVEVSFVHMLNNAVVMAMVK